MANKLKSRRKFNETVSNSGLEREVFSTKLVEELRRLQRLLNHGHDLEVKWIPKVKRIEKNGKYRVRGEIIGKTIYIYDEDEEEAIKTLRHEMIEHLLYTYEKSYVEFINCLIRFFNENQREKREELVEKISKII
jgi:hypothetical protein